MSKLVKKQANESILKLLHFHWLAFYKLFLCMVGRNESSRPFVTGTPNKCRLPNQNGASSILVILHKKPWKDNTHLLS